MSGRGLTTVFRGATQMHRARQAHQRFTQAHRALLCYRERPLQPVVRPTPHRARLRRSAIRVCQPTPVERQRAITSAGSRMVINCLGLVDTGRPAFFTTARASIWSVSSGSSRYSWAFVTCASTRLRFDFKVRRGALLFTGFGLDSKNTDLLAYFGLLPGALASFGLNVTSIITGMDNSSVTSASVTNSPVPEPGSLLLLGSGLVGLAMVVGRRSKAGTPPKI